MTQLAVERYFSVAVELTDGTKTSVRLSGESTADAFKQARERSDVRRVGKVTEISEAGFHSDSPDPIVRSAPQAGENRGERHGQRHGERHGERHNSPSAPSESSNVRRESLIGFTISGPRVVRDARVSGAERPFQLANIQAPPPRPDEEKAPEAVAPSYSPFGPFPPKPQPVIEEKKAEVTEAAPQVDTESQGNEYRVIKSRRKDGLPYLLQRGVWSQQGGKRTFKAGWEKDFETREQAEERLEWLEQMTREAAELQAE